MRRLIGILISIGLGLALIAIIYINWGEIKAGAQDLVTNIIIEPIKTVIDEKIASIKKNNIFTKMFSGIKGIFN